MSHTLGAKRRVSIFVDGSNLFHATTRYLPWKVDAARLLTALVNPITEATAEAFWYQAIRPNSQEDDKFVKFLSHTGYITRTKLLKTHTGATGQLLQKGNMDIEMCTDLLLTADSYDKCIVVSGDGDFIYALNAVRTLGKEVWAAGIKEGMASELRGCVGGRIYDLAAYQERIERKAEFPKSAAQS